MGDGFSVGDDAKVTLVGLSFFLDGVDITDSLPVDAPWVVQDRYVTLTGLLADGSVFGFDLFAVDRPGEDFFAPDATLILRRVIPEPGAGVTLLVLAAGGAVRRPRPASMTDRRQAVHALHNRRDRWAACPP